MYKKINKNLKYGATKIVALFLILLFLLSFAPIDQLATQNVNAAQASADVIPYQPR